MRQNLTKRGGMCSIVYQKKNAQSVLAYALIIGVVVTALLTIQSYTKRAMQGRLKDVADQMGEQFSPPNDPHTNSTGQTTISGGSQVVKPKKGNVSSKKTITKIEEKKTSSKQTGAERTHTIIKNKPLSEESWGTNWW